MESDQQKISLNLYDFNNLDMNETELIGALDVYYSIRDYIGQNIKLGKKAKKEIDFMFSSLETILHDFTRKLARKESKNGRE